MVLLVIGAVVGGIFWGRFGIFCAAFAGFWIGAFNGAGKAMALAFVILGGLALCYPGFLDFTDTMDPDRLRGLFGTFLKLLGWVWGWPFGIVAILGGLASLFGQSNDPDSASPAQSR